MFDFTFKHLSPFELKKLVNLSETERDPIPLTVSKALKPLAFWASVEDEWKDFILNEGISRYDGWDVYEYQIFVDMSDIMLLQPIHLEWIGYDDDGDIFQNPNMDLMELAIYLGHKGFFVDDWMLQKINAVGAYDVQSLVISSQHVADITEFDLINKYSKEEWMFLRKWSDKWSEDNKEFWNMYSKNKRERRK